MTKIVGHRGARGLAPENTIESIEAALAHHVDGVEIDVRVTAEGAVVLSHDPLIREHTYAELKKQKPNLATLEEALDATRGKCALLVEIKPDEPVGPIAKILRGQKGVSVLSFSQKILLEVKKELPGVTLVVNEKWSGVRAHYRLRQLGTKHLQMNQRWLWCGFLWSVHRSGILITPYTVNSPAQAKRWAPYIDGIITDYPDRFEKN
jgi:glycerophosphoryl diester phosphodiesterase